MSNVDEVRASDLHSEETENLILGMMIHSVDALNTCVDALEEEDIYLVPNRLIFRALKGFWKRDQAVDEHVLIEELKAHSVLDKAGGIGFIKSLHIYSHCSATLPEYIAIVKNLSTLRRIGRIGSELYLKSMKPNQSGFELLEDAQAKLFRVSQGSSDNAGKLIKDIIQGKYSESKKSFMEEVQERQQRFIQSGGEDVPFDGVRSGFVDLDKLLLGFGNSHLVILAARPAVGKTAFALNIAERVSVENKIPVGIFSLEMTSDELVMRMICSNARINKDKLTTGNLAGNEFQETYVAAKNLEGAQIIIDDQSHLRMGDLRVRARRMKERYNIGILIIDYLQLIAGSDSFRGDENRQTQVAEISRNMKLLAKELKIPVLCLAQLSRKVEERTEKKPIVSDLRESGALEQDADVVLLLSRPEVYAPGDRPGLAQVIVGKNRHGPTGEVNLAYVKECARFENIAREKEEISDSYKQFTSGYSSYKDYD